MAAFRGFYVHLYSTASLNIYPQNRADNFTNILPESVRLEQPYLVGLTQIVLPHTFFNVQADNNSFLICLENRAQSDAPPPPPPPPPALRSAFLLLRIRLFSYEHMHDNITRQFLLPDIVAGSMYGKMRAADALFLRRVEELARSDQTGGELLSKFRLALFELMALFDKLETVFRAEGVSFEAPREAIAAVDEPSN